MFCFSDVHMYWFIGVGVKNFVEIKVQATAVNTIEFTCLESYHSSSAEVFFDWDGSRVTANFRPFYSKGFSSGVSPYL